MSLENYPLKFFVAYKERQSRLKTFFRLIIAIPWILWLYIWGIAFTIVVVMAWFVLVFTAKWPAELFNFAVKFLRYQSRVAAFILLLTDKIPPFHGKPDDDYGLTYEAEARERYSRPKTGFRMILVIPLSALSYGVQMYVGIFHFLAWWALLFTGRLPRWCYQPLADSLAWYQRMQAYSNLVVQNFPPLAGNAPLPGVPESVAVPAPQPAAPPPAEAPPAGP